MTRKSIERLDINRHRPNDDARDGSNINELITDKQEVGCGF